MLAVAVETLEPIALAVDGDKTPSGITSKLIMKLLKYIAQVSESGGHTPLIHRIEYSATNAEQRHTYLASGNATGQGGDDRI